MRKILILSGLAAIALTGHASAQPARAQLQLTAVGQGCKNADVGRHGESIGDETFCRASLGNGAGTAGRVHWDCAYLGTEARGEDCQAHAELSGGTLQLAGVLSHTRAQSTWAVTGGTGTYAGARGTATLEQKSPTRTAVTIVFQP
jgi:hypothetical protein